MNSYNGKPLRAVHSTGNLPQHLWSFLKLSLALLFLSAALLKLHHAILQPSWLVEPLLPRLILSFQIPFELFLAGCLLAGGYDRLIRRLLLFIFCVFFFVSIYKIMYAEPTCGCFGDLVVSPRWTALLDLLVLCLLLCSRAGERRQPVFVNSCKMLSASSISKILPDVPFRFALKSRILLLFGLSVILFITLLTYTSHRTAVAQFNNGVVFDSSSDTIFVQPSKWLGKRCPILSLIDLGPRLAVGDWAIVFYRRDCETCRSELPSLLAEASAATAMKWVFVEVPPVGGDIPDLIPPSFKKGFVAPGPRWFMQTPAVVCLKDGMVRTARDHLDPNAASYFLIGKTDTSSFYGESQ
jgi:hypothetical protein